MIWQNAWAWMGLAAIAVPIVVHLLGRRRPKPLRFPTLRFLDAARIVPARRHRLNDILLLLVRLAIIIAAVAALAQPLVTIRARPSSPTSIARAVIVDTSTSMERQTSAGRRAIDAARDLAQASMSDATIARVIDAPALAPVIGAASTWLAAQPARRELVIVSDFQTGALDRADLAAVPADVGIALRAIDVTAGDTASLPAGSWGAHTVRPDLRLSPEATAVAWQPASASPDVPAYLRLLAQPEDRAGLDAAIAAARLEGVPAAVDGRAITIVFPGAADRAAIAARVRAIDQPWMFDVVDAIRRDPTIDGLAPQPIGRAGDAQDPIARATPIVADDHGRARVHAGADGAGSDARLVLFAAANPDDALSAALIGRAWRVSANDEASVRENEPTRTGADTLRSWERAPSATPPAGPTDGRSDGRWLWALALLLLGLEAWMRRAPKPNATIAKETAHARVA